MAGVDQISIDGAYLEQQDEEIEALKCIFADEIKITNEGCKYTKVISIKPKNLGISFCFSITELYPEISPRIDLKPETFTLTENQTGNLLQNMYSVARDLKGTPMVLALIEAAKDYLDQINVNYEVIPVEHTDSPQNDTNICKFFQQGRCHFGVNCLNQHPGQKELKNQESQNAGETTIVDVTKKQPSTGKKPPMKIACDVISRIQWDPHLTSSNFVVGYLDRFLGILEQPFDAFSWVDIATVDLNTLAIPRHRIQYFKYQDEVVWDKRVRLDNVFGSTGSKITISDIVKKFQKEGVVEEQKETDDFEQEETDLPEINIPEKVNKNWPNYFVAIRIDNEEIKDNVETVQGAIASDNESLQEACIRLSTLHITLCTMRLDTMEEKTTACDVLKKLQLEAARLLPPSLLLRFQGLDDFGNRVLYSPPAKDPALYKFVHYLQSKFREAGIRLIGIRDKTDLHMTVLKFRRDDTDALGVPLSLDYTCYRKYLHTYFGVQSVESLHLCSIGNPLRFNGFYDCLTSVNLYDE